MSALTGFRVVELAGSVAGEYCGKLLADFGAEVIKIEAPGGGSPTRAMAPILGDGGGCENSALFAYLNTNKQSVVLDGAAGANAWTRSSARRMRSSTIARRARAERHPGVVFCSITPFGQLADAEFGNAKSINVFHASGWGFHTPSHADPAEPPLQGPGRFLADYEAGLEAALCVASALFRRLHTGQGEVIDVSQHAVLVSRADCIVGRFITGEVPADGARSDYDQQGPASFFACADGFVYLYMTSRAHWLGVKALMGHPGWLDDFDDDWLEFSVTPGKGRRVPAGVRGVGQAAWPKRLPPNKLSSSACHWSRSTKPQICTTRRSTAIAVFPGCAPPRARHRGLSHRPVRRSAHRRLKSLLPHRLSASTPRRCWSQLDSPRVVPTVKSAQLKPAKNPRGGPLQGVRVVELTKVWAGPYAGKLLALLGAEVIKVETASHPEEMRAYGGTDINHAPFFLSINPEVLSVDLDIKSPAGMARLRELIARSDIVINNLRPGAMERQGLGYEQLTEIKPDIISVSIKMWGNDGPLGHQTGYAPCFAALAGLASLVGYPGGPPLGASMRYGDSTVGAAAAYAAVVALLHRELSGEGQFVDVSAVETLSSMIGDCLLEQSLTGKRLGPSGNNHPDMCPHGCYPCAGGSWISVAVADDTQWQRLCDVLDAATLSADPRYSTLGPRRDHAGALDAELAGFTRNHDAEELAHRLRAAGVPASKSATSVDVIADQQLWDRELYRFVSDHREGQRPILGPSWRMTRDAGAH